MAFASFMYSFLACIFLGWELVFYTEIPMGFIKRGDAGSNGRWLDSFIISIMVVLPRLARIVASGWFFFFFLS